MKKLLYTLLIGLVIVSCQKEEYGGDYAPAALSNDVEAVSKSDVDQIIENLLDNLSAYGKSKKGTNTSKGSDFVAIHIFTSEGTQYLTLLDETNDDLCFGDQAVSTVFFDNVNGDGSALAVEDTDGNVSLTLNGNFAPFFSGGNNVLVKLNSENKSVAQVNFSDSNTASFD